MKTITKSILVHSMDMAMANGYTLNKYFCIVSKEGNYVSAEESRRSCHPLESVILGLKINGYINEQIAEELKETPQWVDGFIDGFLNKRPNSSYMMLVEKDWRFENYSYGYQDGMQMQEVVEELETAYRSH